MHHEDRAGVATERHSPYSSVRHCRTKRTKKKTPMTRRARSKAGHRDSAGRLRRGSVDVIQMGNPTVAECKADGLVDALQEMKRGGQTRFISGSTTMPHLGSPGAMPDCTAGGCDLTMRRLTILLRSQYSSQKGDS